MFKNEFYIPINILKWIQISWTWEITIKDEAWWWNKSEEDQWLR